LNCQLLTPVKNYLPTHRRFYIEFKTTYAHSNIMNQLLNDFACLIQYRHFASHMGSAGGIKRQVAGAERFKGVCSTAATATKTHFIVVLVF
jgi:hypothetical protein